MQREVMFTQICSRSEVGAIPRMIWWAVESQIVPFLTIGAMVLGPQNLNGTTLGKLGELNGLAALLISQVRRSTPTPGLKVILGLKPLDLVARKVGFSDSLTCKPKIRWDGLGIRKAKGHMWTWLKLRPELGLNNALPDKPGHRHFNWDPPFSMLENFKKGKDTFGCLLEGSSQVHFFLLGGDLTGQVSQQCIVLGQDLYCPHRGFEINVGGSWSLSGEVILSRLFPFTLQQPLLKDSKTKALLSAMAILAERTGNKILLSNN